MQTRKTLLLYFWLPIALSLLMAALFELGLLPDGFGGGDRVTEYYCTGGMELITICCIPLALRLFKLGKVRRAFVAHPHEALLRWGSYRLWMIGIPVVANTLLYYCFVNVAFGYMSIIGLLSMMFVYPSRERCEQETTPQD